MLGIISDPECFKQAVKTMSFELNSIFFFFWYVCVCGGGGGGVPRVEYIEYCNMLHFYFLAI